MGKRVWARAPRLGDPHTDSCDVDLYGEGGDHYVYRNLGDSAVSLWENVLPSASPTSYFPHSYSSLPPSPSIQINCRHLVLLVCMCFTVHAITGEGTTTFMHYKLAVFFAHYVTTYKLFSPCTSLFWNTERVIMLATS